MARTAKKKTVNNKMAYEFAIREKDVIERVNFGSFEVIKTSNGIMFKNYSGYHVYSTPYAVGTDGVARENSLYSWLDNLIDTHHQLSEHLDETFGDETYSDGTPVMNRDIYDMDRITTEANLMYPYTAFIDVNHAAELANKQIRWLADQQKKLLEAMTAAPAPDNEVAKAEAEERARVERSEIIEDIAKQIIENAD